MKQLSALVIVALLATPAAAAPTAEELRDQLMNILDSAWRQDDAGRWAYVGKPSLDPHPCRILLDELKAMGAPRDMEVSTAFPGKGLPAGEHTLASVEPSCNAMALEAKHAAIEDAIFFAAQATDSRTLEACQATYKRALAVGVPASYKVTPAELTLADGTTIRWEGTIDALRSKYCDGRMKAVKAAEQAQAEADEAARAKRMAEFQAAAAPYRKVLKHDKLAMAVRSDYVRLYGLAGGDESMNPKKLASAKYWFEAVSELEKCTNGKPHLYVRRYEFDKQQKLVRKTETEYCAHLDASMYK